MFYYEHASHKQRSHLLVQSIIKLLVKTFKDFLERFFLGFKLSLLFESGSFIVGGGLILVVAHVVTSSFTEQGIHYDGIYITCILSIDRPEFYFRKNIFSGSGEHF